MQYELGCVARGQDTKLYATKSVNKIQTQTFPNYKIYDIPGYTIIRSTLILMPWNHMEGSGTE